MSVESSYEFSLDFLFQSINEIAQDKNCFIISDGIKDFMCKDKILCRQIDKKNIFKSKLWVKNEWLTCTRELCDDLERFDIFIFDKKYQWSPFLNENRSNDSYIDREENLCLIASFGRCQLPSLFIRNDSLMIKQISEYYSKQKFKIVKTLL